MSLASVFSPIRTPTRTPFPTLHVALALAVVLFPSKHARGDGPILLDCKKLTESSGVAVSNYDPNLLWTHNDSGDKARLYLFSTNSGWLQGIFELTTVSAHDWEDMCSFEARGQKFLAIGDVGDNQQKRKSIQVHIVEEPIPNPSTKRVRLGSGEHSDATPIDRVLTYEITYPDGASNCESLAFDAKHSRFLLLTKELLGCRIYSVPVDIEFLANFFSSRLELDENSSANRTTTSVLSTEPIKIQAEYIQTLGITIVTSADISPDWETLAVCTYGPAYLLPRDGKGWSERTMTRVPLPKRRQGEAIAFLGSDRLLVTSEKFPTPLWTVEIPERKSHGR